MRVNDLKKAGSGSESGSIRQRHGSVDPDPHQNVMGSATLMHMKLGGTARKILTKRQALRMTGHEAHEEPVVPHIVRTHDHCTVRKFVTISHYKTYKTL
jgi:hypothetical protein